MGALGRSCTGVISNRRVYTRLARHNPDGGFRPHPVERSFSRRPARAHSLQSGGQVLRRRNLSSFPCSACSPCNTHTLPRYILATLPQRRFCNTSGPALIVVWVAIRLRRWPTRRQSAALAFATLGTFLLVTNGSFEQVVVPPKAIFWGLVSALAMAFYTLYPGVLMRKFGSAVTTGWAMLVGGVAFLPFAQPWQVSSQHWTVTSTLLVVFVILFGTLLAFYLYLSSMHYIAPAETSLLASVEPLSAAVAAVLWLHVQLGYATILGGLSIIMTVVLLAFPATKRPIQRQNYSLVPFS